MSGGRFDYLCFKVEDSDALHGETFNQLGALEAYLRQINKHDAADEVLLYTKELETHKRRLAVIGRRIAPVLKAAEWTASGDWNSDSIDSAYRALMGLNEESE